jgi:hypothetical protein
LPVCANPALVSGLLPSDDTYIDQNLPTTNHGSETTFRVRSNNNAERRGLVRFDLSGIPANATVTSAKLYLYETRQISGQTTYLYRVTHTWSEGLVTWNSPWTIHGGDFDKSIAFASFLPNQLNCMVTLDLTDLVQRWVNGTYPNYGVFLYTTGPNRSIIYSSKENPVAQQRPRLDVSYTQPVASQLEKNFDGLIKTVAYLWNSLISIVAR